MQTIYFTPTNDPNEILGQVAKRILKIDAVDSVEIQKIRQVEGTNLAYIVIVQYNIIAFFDSFTKIFNQVISVRDFEDVKYDMVEQIASRFERAIPGIMKEEKDES